MNIIQFSSVTQSCLTLQPHGLQHTRLCCPSPIPRAYSNSCPLSRWCHPTICPTIVCLLKILSAMFYTSQCMLLLLLSRVSRVRLCANPQTAAHQAPPSLGFSKQEPWSGLPFPSLSNASKWEMKVKSLSRVHLLATPWTAAYQAHPSLRFSRQEYWNRLPCLLRLSV